MKKAIIIALIAVVLGVIFLSISTLSQNEDFEEEATDLEVPEAQPQGRNLSVELEENMGFTAP